MALSAVVVTLGADQGEGKFNSSAKFTSPAIASRTAFEAALATLVADGASPTQAHVTAVDGAYTTLKAAQLLYEGAFTGDLVMSVDTATVTSSNGVKWAANLALQALKNIGIVKP